MPSPISRTAAFEEAEATCDPAKVEFAAIELTHAGFTDGPVRICSREADTTLDHGGGAGSFAYLAVPMRIELPGQEEGRPRPARIVIDNLGREIERYLPAVRLSTSPVGLTIRVYLWPDLGPPAAGPFTFDLTNIEAGSAVSAELTVPRLHARVLNPRLYTAQDFPTLAQGT